MSKIATHRIWIVETGDPLPLLGRNVRLFRAAQIARRLTAGDASVVWWSAAFDHLQKRYIANGKSEVDLSPGMTARLLWGRRYTANVSLARIVNHRQVAQRFRQWARRDPQRPGAIYCCYPTVDLALAAAEVGRERNVPVIIDIRDLWPEVFEEVSPLPRPLTRLALAPLYRQSRAALRGATGIWAITEPALEWGIELAERTRGPHDRVVYHAYERPKISGDGFAEAEHFWRLCGLKLDGSEKIGCWFGTLSETAEWSSLFEAVSLLPEPLRRSLRIVIGGSGPKFEELQRMATGRAEILVVGFLGQAQICALMQHAHFGLLHYPARKDLVRSVPTKVSEYFSAGLPIISTLPGITEDLLAATGSGLRVANRCAPALAKAVVELVTDEPKQAQMAANARALFEQRFNADEVYGQAARDLIALARGARYHTQ